MFHVQSSEAKHDIGGSVLQQDNGLSVEITGQDGTKACVVAIFDGHGLYRGGEFSTLCKNIIQDIISCDMFKDRFDANPHSVGHEIFYKMHIGCFELNKRYLTSRGIQFEDRGGLIYTDDISNIIGGTTATLLIVNDIGQVHCFNVGDSDVWLVDGIKAISLSVEHAPQSKSEYARIQASWPETKHIFDYKRFCGMKKRKDGDHIFPERLFRGYYMKNVSGEMATHVRVKHIHGVSQLAMTRSIGDEPVRHGGVIWEPSYTYHQADNNTVIKMASDGYWDSIVNDDIAHDTGVEINKCGYDANALCDEWFVSTSLKSELNFGSTRDNMWGYVITIKKC